MRTISGLIYVSRIAPGTRITAHVGPTNLRVRCHLGISVPETGCHLEVGGEVTTWRENRCLVFDDSFEHSVWNLSDRDRTVLIVDLWHPDLTAEEITVLSGMQSYASLIAPGLVRYWKKNSDVRERRRLYD